MILDSRVQVDYLQEDRAMHTPRTMVVWMKLHPEGRTRLRGALMLRGMSHRELARRVGWRSHGMVSQLLRGERTSVNAESAVMISKVLGIPVHDLFLTESSSDTRCSTRDDQVAS